MTDCAKRSGLLRVELTVKGREWKFIASDFRIKTGLATGTSYACVQVREKKCERHDVSLVS